MDDNQANGELTNKHLTRRDLLKLSAVAGAGIAIGAAGLGSIMKAVKQDESSVSSAADKQKDSAISMYGEHQAGIITPQQTYMYLAAFRITSTDRKEVIALFKEWTRFADLSTSGSTMKTGDNPLLPPSDTGETLDLPASMLTVTFGFGPTFFSDNGKDRFGISHLAPRYLSDIPRMPREKIDPEISRGDVCVQVCAEDQQVAFHALRNFIRLSTGKASLKWMQEGFISGKSGSTPRNLFGYKDGTANKLHDSKEGYENVVWAGDNEPAWMKGGTYMAYRKIHMLLEVWDRSSYQDQQDTFGRHKESGAAYGTKNEFDPVNPENLPDDSHVALAKASNQMIHRRAYSYTEGLDPRTGNMNAGLLFLSFQQNPQEQFIPMLKLMQSRDALNDYTSHIASAMFACPGGLREGQYIGQSLLEA